ncbi:hypothetical protein GCM10010335_67650 [Streptomyces galbus]|nr:hypothetical protein GCM10010335_67650 [Streptomyces galbus]
MLGCGQERPIPPGTRQQAVEALRRQVPAGPAACAAAPGRFRHPAHPHRIRTNMDAGQVLLLDEA